VTSVNLNDPFFQHRNISFILDMEAEEMFSEVINYVTVSVRKKRSSGNDFSDRFTMDKKYINEKGTSAIITYARGEDTNPDAFEYKTQWSLRGGKVYPDNPQWQKGSWEEAVTLASPVTYRKIEFEADLDDLKQKEITRVTAQMRYRQFGKEEEENIHISPARGEPLVEKNIFIDNDTKGYAYRLILSHKTEGKLVLPWEVRMSDDYIYATLPDELQDTESEVFKEAKQEAGDLVSKAKEKVLDKFDEKKEKKSESSAESKKSDKSKKKSDASKDKKEDKKKKEKTDFKIALMASYQFKNVRQRGTFKISLNKYTADKIVLRFDENIGKINCDECFHQVNLDDPLFKQREIVAMVDGFNFNDFGKYINFVSVKMKKTHQNGDITWDEVRIDRENFINSANNFKLLYGWKGDDDRSEWLDYEYQAHWSFFGGNEVTTNWSEANANAINLAPPYLRETIELEADPELLKENNVRSVSVKFYYKLGESEQVKQITMLPSREEYSSKINLLLPKETGEYDYEITWRLRGNKTETSGRQTTSESILFVDELEI